MVDPGMWVLLAYRLPREPSTPRIAVWRRLRGLGVAQLLDGLVALPLDSRNQERLGWIAQEVVVAGGTAGVWLARPGSAAQERVLAAGMGVVIRGLSMVRSDHEVVELTGPLFDGLYEYCKRAALLGREPS